MNQEKLRHFEEAAEHAGHAVSSGFKALLKLTAALAPVAEVVGTAIGQPEITTAAKLASLSANAATTAIEQHDGAPQ